MRGSLVPAIQLVRARQKPRWRIASHHRRVVAVGGNDARAHAATRPARAPYPPEQRTAQAAFALDVPLGVEDLVPTVLGVGLREHHQLGIGGVPPQRLENLRQIADFVRRKRQAHALVGGFERRDGRIAQRKNLQRPAIAFGHEQAKVLARHDGLRHAVVQPIRQHTRVAVEIPPHAPLHPRHRCHAAVPENVRGLAGPRGNGTRPRHRNAVRRTHLPRQTPPRPVAQQGIHRRSLPGVEFPANEQKVNELREDAAHAWLVLLNLLQVTCQPSARKRGRPGENFEAWRHGAIVRPAASPTMCVKQLAEGSPPTDASRRRPNGSPPDARRS